MQLNELFSRRRRSAHLSQKPRQLFENEAVARPFRAAAAFAGGLLAVGLLSSFTSGRSGLGYFPHLKKGMPGNPERACGDLVFHLTGLTPNRGWARVVLYDSPDKYLTRFGACAADSARVGADGTADITLHKLPFGQYAGSFYQDENHNYVIDRNFTGIPTEPYGFSNGVRAKWRVPSYQSVTFQFNRSGERQDVVLNYWSNQ